MATTSTVDDFPADKSTTGRLTFGNSTYGNVEASSDQDWFAVDVKAGTAYIISIGTPLVGLAGRCSLALYNSNGQLIGPVANGGVGLYSVLQFLPTSNGTYYIAASFSGYSVDAGPVPYSLSAVPMGADKLSPWTDTTASLAIGSTIRGELEFDGDEDWFKVSLQAGLNYTFRLLGTKNGGGSLYSASTGAAKFNLLNATGDAMDEALSGTLGGEPLVMFTPELSGNYFLAVGSTSTYRPSNGTYTVTAAIGPADDVGSKAATAKPMAVGAVISAALESPADQDWFAVDLQAGTTYQFEMRTKKSGAGTLDLPYLGLYDTRELRVMVYRNDGALLQYDSSNGPFGDPLLVYTPQTTGRYYIVVDESGGEATGTYQLSSRIAPKDDIADDSSTQATITVGGVAHGVGERYGDADWFRLEVPAAGNYVVKGTADLTTSSRSAATPALGAVSTNGTGVVVNQARDRSGAEYVLLAADRAGTYFVVANADSAMSPYTLTVVPEPADDFGDAPSTASPIAVSRSLQGRIESPLDKDVFSCEMAPGLTYVFTVARPTAAGPATSDPIREFLTQEYALSGPSADARRGYASFGGAMLVLSPRSAGTYFVGLDYSYGWSAEDTDYVLSVTAYDNSLSRPLAVVSFDPAQSATKVAASTNFTLNFNVPVGLIGTDLRLETSAGTLLETISPGNGTCINVQGSKLVIDPTSSLAPATTYTLRIPAGAIQSVFGQTNASEILLTFTTASNGNTAPVASDGTNWTYEDTQLAASLPKAIDAEGDVFSYSLANAPAHGKATVAQNGNYTYLPDANYWGPDSFVYKVADQKGAANSYEIRIVVNAVIDVITGGNGPDTLVGYSDIDRIEGMAGNDRLEGRGGSDWLFGGSGLDVAVFDGQRARYSVRSNGSGWVVSDTVGLNGDDKLDGIERLQFDDQWVALDLAGQAGIVAKTIGAVLGKAKLSDKAIVGLGLKLLDQGVSYADLVAMAVASPQFAALAGSHSNVDFVRAVFANVVGSAPSAAEQAYYVGLLDRGEFTQASLALMACETSFNLAQVDLVGLAATGLPYLSGPAG